MKDIYDKCNKCGLVIRKASSCKSLALMIFCFA